MSEQSHRTPSTSYSLTHLLTDSRTDSRTHSSLSRRGQALLELAFFGSVMLVLLGAMVSYGLNADFNQKSTMGSFRSALGSAAASVQDGRPTAVFHLQVDDRHIANPSNPFALGPVVPVTSSASVTRSWKMQEVGDTAPELPRIRMALQGRAVDCPSGQGCTTAGFRIEEPIPPENPGTGREGPHVIDRYVEIYGRSSVCAKTACGGACLQTDPQTKQCVKAKKLKIIDRCEGEIINRDACIQQARQIVDSQVCTALCEKGKPSGGSPLNCPGICSQPMNVPWYAQGAVLIDASNRRYTFPNLEALFDGTRALGLQTSFARTSAMDQTMDWENRAVEDDDDDDDDDDPAIRTTTSDLVGYQDTFTRHVLFNDNQGADGLSKGVADRRAISVNDHVCITSCAVGDACPNGVQVLSPGEGGCPSPSAKTWQTDEQISE